ncbi:MAG: hypothetical protein QNJ54_34460 [Prochloraceae cyanobacterium]|nr:hypothetical protein [Prochloraceae cyanobacterium]
MTNSNTETQEIKQLINDLSKQLDKRFDNIDENIQKVQERQARIEGKLEAWEPSIHKITDLAERVGELKNWRQIALIAFAGILGWFLRGRQF